MKSRSTRRHFLQTVAGSALAAPFVTSALRGAAAPNAKLQHISVGAGGQAAADLGSLMAHPAFHLVAVADVDRRNLDTFKTRVKDRFPDLRVYQDWREMFEKEGDKIDSVNVGVPDHMHAAAGMAALAKKKHLYGEKPLTQTLWECRQITHRAHELGLMTQMGIQVSSDFTERLAVEIIHAGVIGKVKEVHTFSEKQWGDMEPVPSRVDTPPPELNWDLWLGVATERPFINGYYHPGEWRKRRDFGTATLGDMGCHIFSSWYRGLALTAPISLKSTGPQPPNSTNWAINGRVEYLFPGTQYTLDKTVKVTWYDGSSKPPDEATNAVQKDPTRPQRVPGQGNIVIGTEGTLLHPHGGTPRLFPQAKFKDYRYPKLEPRDHYKEFVDCCLKGAEKPSANFDYSGPLTEAVLLGCLASQFANQTLEWDAPALRVTNSTEATARIKRIYRAGWEIA